MASLLNFSGSSLLDRAYHEPLTFDILESGTIGWKAGSNYFTRTIEYKKNDGNWISITSSTTEVTIAVDDGDIILFRGDNTAYGSNGNQYYYNYFTATCDFNVRGNIMSMLSSNEFGTLSTISSYCAFQRLFYNNTHLKNASALLMPAITLYGYCYDAIFSGCTSLISAPELPATTLSTRGYRNMFDGCTSLTTAPELPATTLSTYCYYGMFRGCTSLTTAPKLPATTLTDYCYQYMFRNCTSLTTAPELPATALANNCYGYMFYDCTNLETAPELPVTTLTDYCYQYMFNGCTGLTTAPDLPATTLVAYCYRYMFRNCSSLNYIKCLATDISATNCTSNWVSSVAATGTFVKASTMSSWTTGINGIPSDWTVLDNS